MSAIRDIYPSFTSALAACGQGYDAEVIAEVVAYKTAWPVDEQQVAPEQDINPILAVGIAAAGTSGRPLTVLDFGGGCGSHYFRTQLAMSTDLRWAIVETETMARHARAVAKGRFRAYTTIDAAAQELGPIDLVFASGSVQYVPDPIGTLNVLAGLKASYLALARFPMWTGDETIGVQESRLSDNGIGPISPGTPNAPVKYPVTFTNFADVTRTLSDYELLLKTASPTADYEVAGQHAPGVSMIFHRKKNPAIQPSHTPRRTMP